MLKHEKHENPFQFMITQKLGKTIVTKTLALLLFVHVLTELPKSTISGNARNIRNYHQILMGWKTRQNKKKGYHK